MWESIHARWAAKVGWVGTGGRVSPWEIASRGVLVLVSVCGWVDFRAMTSSSCSAVVCNCELGSDDLREWGDCTT